MNSYGYLDRRLFLGISEVVVKDCDIEKTDRFDAWNCMQGKLSLLRFSLL